MTADLSKIQRLIILFGVLSVAAAGWSFLYSMDSNMKNMSGMGMNMKMDKSMGDMKMDKSMGDMKMDKSMGDMKMDKSMGDMKMDKSMGDMKMDKSI